MTAGFWQPSCSPIPVVFASVFRCLQPANIRGGFSQLMSGAWTVAIFLEDCVKTFSLQIHAHSKAFPFHNNHSYQWWDQNRAGGPYGASARLAAQIRLLGDWVQEINQPSLQTCQNLQKKYVLGGPTLWVLRRQLAPPPPPRGLRPTVVKGMGLRRPWAPKAPDARGPKWRAMMRLKRAMNKFWKI